MELQGDIKFFYSPPVPADMKLVEGTADFYRDPGLENGALISLFTHGRASVEDVRPDPGEDLKGWWGDQLLETPFASKLWLLGRSNINDVTITKAKQYANDSVKWMITDGLADKIETVVARGGVNQLNFNVTIIKKGGAKILFKWFINWGLQIFGGLA